MKRDFNFGSRSILRSLDDGGDASTKPVGTQSICKGTAAFDRFDCWKEHLGERHMHKGINFVFGEIFDVHASTCAMDFHSDLRCTQGIKRNSKCGLLVHRISQAFALRIKRERAAPPIVLARGLPVTSSAMRTNFSDKALNLQQSIQITNGEHRIASNEYRAQSCMCRESFD
jgi:hypothetical protein